MRADMEFSGDHDTDRYVAGEHLVARGGSFGVRWTLGFSVDGARCHGPTALRLVQLST
jgi:hypothetical protein